MSSQRERQRERERNQRQLTTPSVTSNGNSLLFSEPIKQHHDDETSKRIKSTLGDFDQVQAFLNDPKQILGISTREITRIKGNKAKIEQILSEMKQRWEPITDDFTDEGRAHHDTLKTGKSVIANDNPNQTDRNNHRVNDNDHSLDDISDDDNLFNSKIESKKRRKVSVDLNLLKSKIEFNDNDNKSSNSSNSSGSSSSSSASSSSSSESSDDEDNDEEVEENGKESDDVIKQEVVTPSRTDTPKLMQAPQPEIATWNLEEFMDKNTTTTSMSSTTVTTNTTTSMHTLNSYDNVANVIDRVAKGELGFDHLRPANENPTPIAKKRRKSSHQTQDKKRPENEKNDQQSSQTHAQYKQSSHRQTPLSPQTNHHHHHRDKMQHLKESSPIETPKNLLVSIKLMVLKRIPCQITSDSSSSKSSNCSDDVKRSANTSIDTFVNDDNNNFQRLNKLPHNSKSDAKINKIPDVNNKPKEANNKNSNSKSKAFTALKEPIIKQEPREPEPCLPNTEYIPVSASSTSAKRDMSVEIIKTEPHSPLPPIPPLPLMPHINFPAPLTTVASSMSLTNLRTPPQLSSVGQPDDYLVDAKRLKHDADRETDRTVQACKYLEAVMFFILTGNAMELRSASNDSEKVWLMYKETLSLLRQITSKFTKTRSSHQSEVPSTDHKLTTLSFRCQSLLYLKLCRLKSKEIRDNTKVIQLQTPESNLTNGSSITIPTSLYTTMQRQIGLLQQLNTAHDTWQQGDHLIDKYPSCKAFFTVLDDTCGCLSLNSTFDQLVHYVRTGLKILN